MNEGFSNIPFVAERFKWGEAEIISTEKENIDKKSIFKKSPLTFHIGEQATEENIIRNLAWCEEEIKKEIPAYTVHCSLEVYHENKTLYLVVGLQRKTKTLSTRPPPAVLLDYKLITLRDHFNEKIIQLWGTDKNLNEMLKKDKHNYYHVGFVDPDLDKEADDLVKRVSPHKGHLLDVITQNANENDKFYAAHLLCWATLTKEDITFLIRQFSFQTAETQGKIAHLLNLFSSFIEKPEEIKILQNLDPLITSIDYETRTQGLSLTYTLLKKSPDLKIKIDFSTKEFIEYLAIHAILPNEKRLAKKIILLLNER